MCWTSMDSWEVSELERWSENGGQDAGWKREEVPGKAVFQGKSIVWLHKRIEEVRKEEKGILWEPFQLEKDASQSLFGLQFYFVGH